MTRKEIYKITGKEIAGVLRVLPIVPKKVDRAHTVYDDAELLRALKEAYKNTRKGSKRGELILKLIKHLEGS